MKIKYNGEYRACQYHYNDTFPTTEVVDAGNKDVSWFFFVWMAMWAILMSIARHLIERFR